MSDRESKTSNPRGPNDGENGDSEAKGPKKDIRGIAKQARDGVVNVGNIVQGKFSYREFEDAFGKMMAPAKAAAQAEVRNIRAKNPEITSEELLRKLKKRFVSRVTSTGAAVGGSAALPGVGTVAALGAALGDGAVSVGSTMFYVYAVLDVLELDLEDLDSERAFILTVLLGGSGSSTVTRIAERTGGTLGKKVAKKTPRATIQQINKVLGRNFVTRYGSRQGIVVLGKIAPFGIGAAIGAGLNYALAQAVIKATNATVRDVIADLPTPRPDIEELIITVEAEVVDEDQADTAATVQELDEPKS
ncbi:hypothetical protein [Corynebacterium pelargi]|uniref:Uncharacterized protein n=1 Tax=Corynebacterium pelargi TaxID=1471400 RepID=A0A410W8Z9_9CORY|nr:hypothetical protein [Corynebacterium pelargi]QAU52433.1 hypothetical protein CPELA_05815 [Corynebacterium pelargi]GGG67711.1 hypothetical protein GCM10007338_00330 [Corynebacterium pelargi]